MFEAKYRDKTFKIPLASVPLVTLVWDWEAPSPIEHSYISRSEQAPGSEFHPRGESEKNDCGFLGPSWCNKKVNPETYVSCGSYELLLSNVAQQMKEKLAIQKKFSHV